MWRVDLARTMSGQVGARLAVEAAEVTDELSGIPHGMVTVRRSMIERIDPRWWEPGRNSVVVSHRHSAADEWRAIMAGPIIHFSKVNRTSLDFEVAGIQHELTHRYRTHEWTDFQDNEAWKRGSFYYEGSLGQIAWLLVEESMRKPRGHLPIIHGTPAETVTDSTRVGRDYQNWDIGSGNLWDQVLKEIRETGPDMRFAPEWVPGERRIRWRMEHGTHHDPHIAHGYTLRVDATAAQTPATDVEVTLSGLPIAHRVYATGAGEGPGTWIRVAEDIASASDEMPIREAYIADTSEIDPAVLLASAQARLSRGGMGAWQAAFTVRTSPTLPMWQVRVGAPIAFKVRGLAPFPDGWHAGRIVKTRYDVRTDAVDIEIEEA